MSAIRRRKFLVVVDETPECRVAMRFAARRAEHTGGVVSLAHIMPLPDTQHWAKVALDRMLALPGPTAARD